MIVLDVETTGLYPEKNSLVSIGAVDFSNPEDRFYEECRIWEGAEVAPEALKINGLTEEELVDQDKKTESDIVKNFLFWVSEKADTTIAGQNPFLDVAFIAAAAKRAGEKSFLAKRIVDQHSLAYAHMLKRGIAVPLVDRKTSLDSDAIMKYVGLPTEPKPHIAINGALWETEAIYRLIYDKPFLEDFLKYPVPWV